MRDFDWNLIKSFLAVVDHETLMRAANELKISQPTLGRHITELEQTTGIILFERGRSGMRPTQAALALAAQARDMQREADQFTMLATSRDQTIEGTVRITASQIVANFLLPNIISKFRHEEPGIQIEIISSNAVQNLLARDADIAVRMTRPTQNDIVARKVHDFAMGAYAHKSYLARAPKLSTIDDLKHHTVLGYDRDDLIIKGMMEVGIKVEQSDFDIRTDDQVAYWHLLCAGAGIGFSPKYLAARNPDLVRLFPDFPIPSIPMWLASHQELKTSARIRRTLDYVGAALAALPLNPTDAHSN